MQTRILTDEAPLDAVIRGAETLYKAVSVTMGPKGKNVIFKKYGKRTGMTHDGVTVAKLVRLNDEADNLGAEILREAAIKVDTTTGDGTTTVTVLAYSILAEAAKRIKDGESPMAIKVSLEKELPSVIEKIKEYIDTDVTLEKLQQVASLAAGDKEIGETVGKLIFDAGSDTPIILNFSGTEETRSEIINGFKIDSGPASPYLSDGSGARREIPTPYIVVVDAKLRNREDVLPLLKVTAEIPDEKRRFLLVCTDIAGDALAYMVANKVKGFADIAVARVPEKIGAKTGYLQDLAVACGATLMARNSAASISEPKLEYFGSADAVAVEQVETVIINGHAIPEDLEVHTAKLKDLAENSKTKEARKYAEDRLYALEQKLVGIFVGGQSEPEAEEKHYRYEDAIGAAKTALRSGVVPGGGTMLYEVSDGLSDILSEALKQPLLKVLENAGIEPELKKITAGHGYDVMDPEDGVIDLYERGILDPAESELECVKTAVSIAGLLMTSGALIVDEIDETEPGISASQS